MNEFFGFLFDIELLVRKYLMSFLLLKCFIFYCFVININVGEYIIKYFYMSKNSVYNFGLFKVCFDMCLFCKMVVGDNFEIIVL